MEERKHLVKIICLSDIHANWNYLSQVIPFIEAEKAEKLFFLGDAIGYYDEPDKVINWLRVNNVQCIKGNHEQYFLNELQYESKREDIYRVRDNQEHISSVNKAFINTWMDKLELVIEGKKFLLMHGEEENSEKYVYQCSNLNEELLKEYDYYVYGHTHIPLVQYHYGCCVINPGSIGQPRDYTTKPSYVVVDLERSEVVIKKFSVDVKSYTQHLQDHDYCEKVVNILTRQYK